MTTHASASTVTFVGGSSRKFYRIIVIGNREIRQWGRLGTRGQSQLLSHEGKRAAEYSAEDQLQTKIGKGYGSRVDHEFTITGNAQAMESTEVIEAYERAMVDSAASEDPIEDLERRAKNVVSLLATGSPDAFIEYTRLASDRENVQRSFEQVMAFISNVEVMMTGMEMTDA